MAEKFTDNDAADLITLARRAPLKNMDEAAAASNLLDRFAVFFEAIESEQTPDDNVTKITPGSAD